MSAADVAPTPLWIGGRYELIERLGQGTTCEVHLARTVRRDGEVALVALRRPLASFAADPRFVEELLASGRGASQLLHPGIARVLDVSTDPRTPFVATEYVHGEQLGAMQRRLAPGQRPLDILLRVVAQAAEAVQHGHAARTPLVHGSITPQNVFIAYDGEVRVSDFATPRPPVGPEDSQSRDHAGVGYWSPEQAAQRLFDAPADVFALGVILWECITQRRLFNAPTRAETRALVKRCEVPRPGDITDCPAALERIVMCCLARDPHERLPSAGVLADELSELLEKRRRDASAEAIRRLVQELFAQRKVGRDATLRRAMHPSRESYAPLAAASPSILPGDLAGVLSTHGSAARPADGVRPTPAPAEASGLRPARSSALPAQDRAEIPRAAAMTPSVSGTDPASSAKTDPVSSTKTDPVSAAKADPVSTSPSTRFATATTSPSKTTSTVTTEPDAAEVLEPAEIPTQAGPAPVGPVVRPTRAQPGERSFVAWGGFVAIGLGLIAVLGVLAQVLTTPRAEAPVSELHAATPLRVDEPTASPPDERTEPAIETRVHEPVALENDDGAIEPVGDVVPTVPQDPSPTVELEDPREEPATEAMAFPALGDDHGTLEVLCTPAAEIFVDNRSLGLTPRIVDVPEGPIAIGLRSTGPGHAWRTLRRTIEPRGTLSIPMTECP